MVEKDEERQEGYWPRVADAVLQRALRASGAVQIVGAKWCGKTETAKQQAQSAVYLQDPDEGPSLVALAEVRPSVLLEGAAPHRRMADGAAAVGCRPFRGRPGEGQGPVHPHRFGYAQEETEAFRRGTDIPYAYAPHVALRIPRVYGRGLTSGALRWCRRGGRHI